jgi:hypothetical protein
MLLAKVDSYWARLHNDDSPSFTIMYKETHINFVVGLGLCWLARAAGSFVLPR